MKKVSQRVKHSLICAALTAAPQLAFAVNKSDSGLNSVNTWISTIIPIIAGIALLILAVLYMAGFASKKIFEQIGGGLLLGGCGSWLISLFF